MQRHLLLPHTPLAPLMVPALGHRNNIAHTGRHQRLLTTVASAASHTNTSMTASAAVPASRKVAVIGAGAAGLASIRELLREGHQVVAYEQGPRPGGTWVYDTTTDSDALGAAAGRRRVHGSMYRDLRTNLPREVMSYTDTPFTPQFMGQASSDPRRFPGHAEVLSYLQLYADIHNLHQHVQYNTQVLAAAPLHREPSSCSSSQHKANGSTNTVTATTSNSSSSSSSPRGGQEGQRTAASAGAQSNNINNSSSSSPAWSVSSIQLDDRGQQLGQAQQQVFDAVVVANGHYSQPNLPEVSGADSWPGLQMHSHNYRVPEAFAGQVVVVVGASNSGEDVCREVAAVADQVVVAARSWKNPEWAHDPKPYGPRNNISRRGMVSALHPDGRVEFAQGPALPRADTIIYATGYRYSFPFLEQHASTAHLSGQQHVPALYQHMFVPSLGHSLSFVGLPWKIVPFPQFELQAKYIARLLSGRAQLPPLPEMEASVAAHYKWLQEQGRPLRYCHMMDELQWPYNDWLAAAAGPDVQSLPAWRPAMYAANRVNKLSHPEDYRDRWDDLGVAAAAEAELTKAAALKQQQLSQETQHVNVGSNSVAVAQA